MKISILSITLCLSHIAGIAQCSTVSVQISSSDTSYIQLYNAGIFNIPSGSENICEWKVADFDGNVIHEDITSGDFANQSFSIFDHSTPITDSMKATLNITNDVEGITCTMNDTLYWKNTEVLPGSFVGNWDVLSSNGGIEEDISTETETTYKDIDVQITPSPAREYFAVNGDLYEYSINILNSNGQKIENLINITNNQKIEISHLTPGLYFIQFYDVNQKQLAIRKILKI